MKRLSLSLLFATMKRNAEAEKSEISQVKKAHWSHGMLNSMNDPVLKVLEDDLIVVIKDKYPKAKFHYLVIPKEDIKSIIHVKKENLNLLQHMEEVGQNISKKHNDSEFIIGYHAIPSMQRLHLHVISTDFNNSCLKTKQHWNSFTTPFFLSSQKNERQADSMASTMRVRPSTSWNICPRRRSRRLTS
ncbi:aprataxin isoform X2 [Leptopilina boulardi]|uniref:aprataxin isoform X2 n=1 Tax=Leptopilina boulardi TaxID=63433 RepID=UPI0021F5C98B|nr:aprataxin isoform X2 [Leptopilina boulardi]